MGYDYAYSTFTARFKVADLPHLAGELQELRKNYYGQTPLNYCIGYFSGLYDDDVKVVDELRYYDPPEEVDVYTTLMEGDRVQILYNAEQMYVFCFEYRWHGPGGRRIEDELRIISKYCEPFKFIQHTDFSVFQYLCFHETVIYKCLVDEERDIGKLTQDEIDMLTT